MVSWLEQCKEVIKMIVVVGVCEKSKRLCQLVNLSLLQERIASCYRLMRDVVVDGGQRKPPKVLLQLRVMTPASVGADSSSSSSSSPNKRRKLNNCLLADDDKERE
eukprot:TRINITY_DN1484_c0_g1_i5.p4 TRINITY_DN1484_c0_g1~~TRINITY_DN1484_c0_g1_i5.p4  ORF type:complete len:106 (-),score=21.63 TRINITY_DN1484_c0_g1_i5:1315-1632(-)